MKPEPDQQTGQTGSGERSSDPSGSVAEVEKVHERRAVSNSRESFEMALTLAIKTCQDLACQSAVSFILLGSCVVLEVHDSFAGRTVKSSVFAGTDLTDDELACHYRTRSIRRLLLS